MSPMKYTVGWNFFEVKVNSIRIKMKVVVDFLFSKIDERQEDSSKSRTLKFCKFCRKRPLHHLPQTRKNVSDETDLFLNVEYKSTIKIGGFHLKFSSAV